MQIARKGTCAKLGQRREMQKRDIYQIRVMMRDAKKWTMCQMRVTINQEKDHS